MNFGHLKINDICKCHGMAFDEAMRRMLKRGYPLHRMQHLFDQGSDEEFVVCDRRGYHLEKALTADGRLEIKVQPGHFSATFSGDMHWVDDVENPHIWTPAA